METLAALSLPRIDCERLLEGLDTLRGFGRDGSGVRRTSFGEADLASRRWLCERMEGAGLAARIDGVGNVVGVSPKPGPALLLGSHSDTQPVGGYLDGALGVVAAIEVARALAACPATAHLAVDVMSFVDEEGSHYGFLGSLSAAGLMTQAGLDAALSHAGVPLPDLLRAAGLSTRVEPLALARYAGFLELHIEQGPWLDDAGEQLGVVSAIVGARNLDITTHGQMNHAGSTPMDRRRDAGRALIVLAHELDMLLACFAGPYTVWNFGRMEFLPGATAIVPAEGRLRLQFRDQDEALLDRIEAAVGELVAAHDGRSGVECRLARRGEPTRAVGMDAGLREACVHAAQQVAPGAWRTMPSGALHDAGILGRVMPAAMLFVPSIGGISHNVAEETCREHLCAGAEALLSAVLHWAMDQGRLAAGGAQIKTGAMEC